MNYVRLYYDDGYVLAAASEEPRIDSAVTQFLTSGKTRDDVLEIELLDGCTLKLRVSSIESWYLSTPETRRRQIEVEKALEDEKRDNRAAVGLFDGET